MTSEAAMSEGLRGSERELDSEAALVRAAKARSQAAWTQIYEQCHPKLYRYALARVGDQSVAEDLTATVFLEALKGIDSFTARGRPLLAWLYSIARNVVNYHHRSRYRRGLGRQMLIALSQLRGEHANDAHRPQQPAPTDAGELADPASAVERWDLREAIGRLSADQREVIILRYFVGLTTPEVADVLGKHERAVYSLQTRAIKALRRHLG